jgi:hypothetical protein
MGSKFNCGTVVVGVRWTLVSSRIVGFFSGLYCYSWVVPPMEAFPRGGPVYRPFWASLSASLCKEVGL